MAETAAQRAEVSASSVNDHNAFAVALYERLHLQGGNQCFSPFSIRAALAMAYAGARGDTAAQMREALRVSNSDDALYAGCAELVRSLSDAGGRYEIAVANSAWSQIDAPLEPAFVELIARHFGGAWNLLDFGRGAEAARATINRWMSDRTEGRILEVLAAGSPAADTRLVLVNAVYFKGQWTVPFDKDRTRDEPFFLEGGNEVRVPLMHQTELVGYRRGTGYQAITLPYQGRDLALLVLLPDRRDGLADLESSFSAAMIKECLEVRGTRRVEISLPRFTATWGTAELGDALAALGMRLAFTRKANFSGVNGHVPPDERALFISSVLHKAFVDVNEEGTEAAAATLIHMTTLGMPLDQPPPVPIFRADHPFLFAICEAKTGAVIFLGRMLDPTRQT